MTTSCPSCGTGAPPGSRFCGHCGHYVPPTAPVAAYVSNATSRRPPSPVRRRVASTALTSPPATRPKPKQTDRRHAAVPSAAAGDEAAAIYKQLLAAVRGANAAQHEAVVAAFKSDCRRYGQGELRARALLDRLATYFGGALLLDPMLPQLARLIPDDHKRRKLLRVHAKQARARANEQVADATLSGRVERRRRGPLCGAVTNPNLSRQLARTRRTQSNADGSRSSDTSSSTSGEVAPVATSWATTRAKTEPVACAICSDVFDMQRRRHACRKCGASVCHLCSPAKMLLAPSQVASEERQKQKQKNKYDPAHPQRVCTICAPVLQCLQHGLSAQYANCHKENPHEAKTRLHLPFSRSLESACRSAADIVGNFFRPGFGAASDRYIPAAFLKRARGIAFLTVVKAGLLLTAKVGTGVVIAKLDSGSWSAPSAIGTAGIGGGLEGGGELIEFMIIMGSAKAVKVFHRTQVNVGGGLSLAIGPYGRDALAQAAASRGGFNANYSYSHSRGLFAGLSLHGAVITARTEMNRNFYGQQLTPEQILSGAVPRPRAAQCLYDAIDGAMRGVARFEAAGRESQRRSSLAAADAMGRCSSCRCNQFVLKAFSKKCKTCAHVHKAAK
ncbi:unnamed protein product [Hyaloperonospora brassicae]|uniref:FYVE-type domain-containing protein n=1 Tax=Hyaloperonospora brassicae TaxID=162125 RepID=A0AAV0U3V4_HYABA|nr:unnamed protein product [Hyaloperonospora brassicae]